MKKLGKYEILEEIGRGGFAVVYKARDTALDRFVALKVLHPQLTIDPKFIERFYYEAQTAAGLHHSHIVTIHDVGEEDGQYYLAMEFLSGQPLSQLIESGPLPVEQVVSISGQVASALDTIHEQGLIHRDVKPSNIRVDETGQATLLDFGIVRAAEGTRLTTTMAVLGTPEYMAPEQAEIEEAAGIDWRADIYALGVVVYEMLVGRPPFTGRSPTGILYKHIHEPPPLPTTLNPEFPEVLEPILLKALAKKREERYQSAGEMHRDLQQTAEAEVQALRQEEQLEELYRRLQKAVWGEDWSKAEKHCREILTLEPEYQDVPELWMQVRESHARQRELEELYSEVQTKAESGAWAEVKDLCQRIGVIERGYRNIDELLRQAEEKLQEQRRKELHPSLALRLSVEPQTVDVGSPATWTVVLRNDGDDDLRNIVVGHSERLLHDQPFALAADMERRFTFITTYETEGKKTEKVGAIGIAGDGQKVHDEVIASVHVREDARLAQLYKQARTALQQERWEEARQRCADIEAAVGSGYRDVSELLRQAEAGLRRKQAEETRLPQTQEQLRRPIPTWAWIVGGGALIVLIILGQLAFGGGTSQDVCTDEWGCATFRPGQTIRIAYVGPYSGDYSAIGIDLARGAELAVKAHPQVKGFDLELVIEDTQGTADQAASVANKLAADPQVVGIDGHTFSGSTEAVIPIYQKAGIVMMSPSAMYSDLTKKGSDVFNRVIYTDKMQAEFATRYIFNTLGIKKIAVMHDGSAYGDGLAEDVVADFEALGGLVVALEGIRSGQTDYSAPLAVIAAGGPELIYYGGYDADAAVLATQMSGAGLEDVLLFGCDGTYGMLFIDLAGDAAEGSFSTYVPIPESAAFDEFRAEYRAVYGEEQGERSFLSPYSYDAATVLINAIEAVAIKYGDNLIIPRKTLADKVRSTSSHMGLTGEITCSATGECAAASIQFFKVENGDWVLGPGQ